MSRIKVQLLELELATTY